MHNYNPDLTSAIMVTAAHQLLKNFIENRENLDELTKDTCVNRMEELLENYLLEFGLGWVASKNLICRFKTIDFKNKRFDYYQPMIYEDFIAGSLPLLQRLFDPDTLVDQMLNMKSTNSNENQFARAILYKAHFGLELFQAMTRICNIIPELQYPTDKYQYMVDSVMYNTWWNEMVNYERFLFEIHEKDGSVRKSEVYIKPIIAVKPDRYFLISNCRLVYYNA